MFRHLLIVGNLKMLSCNTVWGKVIEHCQGKLLSSLCVKTTIGSQQREWPSTSRIISYCLPPFKAPFFSIHPQSKGFPGGLCHSQDFMKKWRQENNDKNKGKSRQFCSCLFIDLWPLNGDEAAGDLVLIQTSLLFCVKLLLD